MEEKKTSDVKETEIKEVETKKKNSFIIYIIVFFIGCLAMYALFYFYPAAITEHITKLEKDVTVTDAGIADAVEKVYDAVVVVSTYNNDKLSSAGTGFIYKKDGNKYYILTNHHVIENGDNIKVTLTNEKILDIRIVGFNEYADIAVLLFESKEEYSVAPLGYSEKARVGDTVFSVGAPLDDVYSWTVTRGILSGKDRMVEMSTRSMNSSDYVMKVLQTDTAINSGNSGGPLCNSNGEVIGITSLKLVSSGIEGMGFAIPIEDALDTAGTIVSGEATETPYLGISMNDLSNARYYEQFYKNMEKANITTGVAVVDVAKGSPAEKAGLAKGDIIVKLGDKEVVNIAYLRYYLYHYKVGDKVQISFYRDGKLKTADIVLSSNSPKS